MMDINMIIAGNILTMLKKQGKKQVDLANEIGVSKQVMSKMLNGSRTISAAELKQISRFLRVSMEQLMEMPEYFADTDIIHTFMGKVKSDKAKEALKIADEVSDLILFHQRVKENGIMMMQPKEQ
ncbi:MAG: helix-turn-helix transcriptional regulator [Faecalicoccus sp.]|nr:helix-turn-helix transcriptional regulator [Faecalicoccus sp.]